MAPTPMVLTAGALTIIMTLVGLWFFGRGVGQIVGIITAGQPESGRWHHPWGRAGRALWQTLSHQTFRGRPLVRAAHWLVMVSFVVLVVTLVTSYLQVWRPDSVLPFFGTWAPWNWLTEFFAWAGLLGIVALMLVRLRTGSSERTSRFFGSTRWQAHFVEWVILLVCLAVLILHGLQARGDTFHFPLTAWLGSGFADLSPSTRASLIVLVSTGKIVVSMAWMIVVGLQVSMGVSWHRFLAPLNLMTSREDDLSKSLGALAPIPTVDGELDEDHLGLGTVDDLTWKDRLDVLSCTECGRCQDVCPAWNTQKPLSPKLLTLAVRDRAAQTHSGDILGALLAAGVSQTDGDQLVPDVLGPDMIWDCTMCGACVEQCPVDIEHVDRIANLRRFQVLMESAFPRELRRPFKGMETKGNPYGLPAKKRLDWAKDLAFDVPVIGEDLEDATEVEYLFWVGCAGAYDDRAKKTTAAVAELLHTAGVSFAVLGSGESCTGDPARRAGNEVLFQLLAEAAIDTLNEAKAQRIVVTCAHCFNTIANEYPEMGGHYEVIHHTQLLNRLVREGALTPTAPPEGQRITYHDPCFLGRHNRVFSAPRELLGSMLPVIEMPRSGENSFCCGAGGARAWMEETRGTRIATNRLQEAADTGATTVATACPFCTQMFDSASASVTGVPAPEVKDVAMLLLEGVHRSQAQDQA
ncbi:(Fe-S)-binding protein [Scrofimicrobium sp. R131]|uniref:(Fe-S)-binding protein n=1 Tax=Scrofimicrobium appendicitidis TaxID=3079930 RepID=A0AAU7V7Z7_9ACTO